jgi:hypothetical protein
MFIFFIVVAMAMMVRVLVFRHPSSLHPRSSLKGWRPNLFCHVRRVLPMTIDSSF